MEQQTHIVSIDLDESSCKVMKAILQKIQEIEVKSETTDFTKGLDLIKQVKPSIVIPNLFAAEEPVFNFKNSDLRAYSCAGPTFHRSAIPEQGKRTANYPDSANHRIDNRRRDSRLKTQR
jgi:hypothetical protein